MSTPATKIHEAPAYFHVLRDGLSLPTPDPLADPSRPSSTTIISSRVVKRGESFPLSADLIEATKDRDGFTRWPEIVSDPEGQARAWGQVYLAPNKAEDDPEFAAELAAEKEKSEEASAHELILELHRQGKLKGLVAALKADKVAEAVGRYKAVQQTSEAR